MKHTPLYTEVPTTSVVTHVYNDIDEDGDRDLNAQIQFVRDDHALVFDFGHMALLSLDIDAEVRIGGRPYDAAADLRVQMGAVMALYDAVAEFKEAFFKAAEANLKAIEEVDRDV